MEKVDINTKYFIFLDNSGSMKSYYTNVKYNLHKTMLDLSASINPTILTFDDLTKELEGSNFQEKLANYHTTSNCTYMAGIVERFTNYLSDAPNGQKICILFITDGAVQDLQQITPFLLTCVDIIINKKLSVFMSCVAINSSADMKTFSLLGLLNNFSVFQLLQSKDGDNWSKQVVNKFKEIETCETSVYTGSSPSPPCVAQASSNPSGRDPKVESSNDFIYSDIVVDSKICELGPYNKVYLATLVQAFTICNFDPSCSEGFMMCKKLLKYIADLGINEKTRYIWSKLNTAKMVGDKNSNVIANEFVSTINDCNKIEEIDQKSDDQQDAAVQKSTQQDYNISITNEHNVRVRLFVGKTKSFTQCLPITINDQNQITIQSEGLNELYLNVEVYHPNEPIDLEISYGNSKHRWYVPYGVSLIEGDVKYLMLAHEKLKQSNSNHEKMFDFIIKAVPTSLCNTVTPLKTTTSLSLFSSTETDSLNCVDSDEDDSDYCDQRFASIKPSKSRDSRACYNFTPPKSLKSIRSANSDDNDYCLASIEPSRSYSYKSTPPKSLKSTRYSAKAFATVSKETRKIDTVKREHRINSNAHVLCFSFVFVYDSENFEFERLSAPTEIIYITKECVICLENDSTIKFKCNHQCICSPCYGTYINNRSDQKCPLCRQLV